MLNKIKNYLKNIYSNIAPKYLELAKQEITSKLDLLKVEELLIMQYSEKILIIWKRN